VISGEFPPANVVVSWRSKMNRDENGMGVSKENVRAALIVLISILGAAVIVGISLLARR